MSSHVYHQALPDYHPDQILHDGCPECEYRGKNVERAIANLDTERFHRAWLRAADWKASTPPSGKRAEAIAFTEIELLRTLWAVQVRLEGVWPLGTLPSGTR